MKQKQDNSQIEKILVSNKCSRKKSRFHQLAFQKLSLRMKDTFENFLDDLNKFHFRVGLINFCFVTDLVKFK